MGPMIIYAGSFDPITNGHLDVLRQCRKMFTNCYIWALVASNPDKKCLFTPEERTLMINKCGFQAVKWDKLVADWGRGTSNKILVRGVRNVTDMMYEMNLASINEELCGARTVFIPTDNQYRNVSSSTVKELLKYGKDISKYVPAHVKKALKEKLCAG